MSEMERKNFIYSTQFSDKLNHSKSHASCSTGCMSFILPAVHSAHIMNHGLFESELISWSKQLIDSSKCFIDVGAHSGTYSIFLSQFVTTVHAFEPQKMSFYALCGSICLSGRANIDAHPFALGSVEQVGTSNLYINSIDGGSSSLFQHADTIEVETIEVRTLDSFKIGNVGFIKIDAESNEVNVIKGGLMTLEESYWPKILFESNQYVPELWDLLKNLGYRIIGINGYKNMFLAEK